MERLGEINLGEDDGASHLVCEGSELWEGVEVQHRLLVQQPVVPGGPE